MDWCRQATNHYLSQPWPRSLLPYGVTWPQRVKSTLDIAWFQYYAQHKTTKSSSWLSMISLLNIEHIQFHVIYKWNTPLSPGALDILNMAHHFKDQKQNRVDLFGPPVSLFVGRNVWHAPIRLVQINLCDLQHMLFSVIFKQNRSLQTKM